MITETHRLKEGRALVPIKWHAERVALDESQFLSAVNRDLCQPLETLGRLRGILARAKDKEALSLIARINEVASDMVNMLEALLDFNQSVMQAEPRRADTQDNAKQQTIFMVGDETLVREAVLKSFHEEGWGVLAYPNGNAFLNAYRSEQEGCLIIDARIPGMSGLELLEHLKVGGNCLPTIMITGHADIRLAVRAMKAGVVGFLEKPIQCDELIANVKQALEGARNSAMFSSFHAEATRRIASLTARERQVMKLVVEGNPNKQIAYVLGINQRTVETHRATVMKKIGARSLPELIHLTLAGSPHGI